MPAIRIIQRLGVFQYFFIAFSIVARKSILTRNWDGYIPCGIQDLDISNYAVITKRLKGVRQSDKRVIGNNGHEVNSHPMYWNLLFQIQHTYNIKTEQAINDTRGFIRNAEKISIRNFGVLLSSSDRIISVH